MSVHVARWSFLIKLRSFGLMLVASGIFRQFCHRAPKLDLGHGIFWCPPLITK